MAVSATALIVTIGLGVLAFAVSLDRILYNSALDAAKTQAAQVAASVSNADSDAPEAVREISSQGSLLQLLDTRRTVVASSDEAASTTPLTSLRPRFGQTQTDQTAAIPGERGEPFAIVARGIRDRSGTDFTLVVAAPLDVEATTVRTATGLLAAGSALLLLLLTGLIYRTVATALQPVERIREEVARIDRAGATDRITVPPSDDEIARLAETMNQMLQRLERADASTRQFVSDASHELRSPLATIRAALEVSAAAGETSDRERDALMAAETIRMQRLVDDLLTLAKADDQGLTLGSAEVDLDDVVDAEVRRLRATTMLDVRSSITAARVVGDEARLAQVLRNLTDNAVRHSTKWVAVSVGAVDGQAVLRVDNQGPPIAENERHHVFDRFVRLEHARERDSGGSGLGLAIAQTVVEAHGGTIAAVSTPEGQCRFEVRLPLAP